MLRTVRCYPGTKVGLPFVLKVDEEAQMRSSWSGCRSSKIQRQETSVRPYGTKVATQTYHIQVSECPAGIEADWEWVWGREGQHQEVRRMMTDIVHRKPKPHIRYIRRDFHHANRISMLEAHPCTHPQHVHAIRSRLTTVFNASAKVAWKEKSGCCSFLTLQDMREMKRFDIFKMTYLVFQYESVSLWSC